MADFKLAIDCDNAAFEDRGLELARILHRFADRVADWGNASGEGTVRDINSNVVGTWTIKEREDEDV